MNFDYRSLPIGAFYFWLLCCLTFSHASQGQTIIFDDGSYFRRLCWHPQTGNIEQTISVRVEPGRCGNGNYRVNWGDGATTVIERPGLVEHKYNLTTFKNSNPTGVLSYNIIIEPTAEACLYDPPQLIRLVFLKIPIPAVGVTAACEDVRSTFNNLTIGRSIGTDRDRTHNLYWQWEFSDGTTYPNSGTINKSFPNPNITYSVRLGVRSDVCPTTSGDEFDFSEWVSFDLKKLPTTVAQVVGPEDGYVCFEDDGDSTIVLDASASRDANRFHWDIAGGSYEVVKLLKPDSSQMQIKLLESATYQVSIRAQNECGLARGQNATFTTQFEALPLPEISLIPQPDGCEELRYLLIDAKEGAEYYLYRGGVREPLVPDEEVVLPVNEEAYEVEGILRNACGVRSDRISFYVHPKSPVEITSIPLDTTVCFATDPLPLEASRSGGEWISDLVTTVGGRTVFTTRSEGEFEVTYQVGTGLCLTADTRRIRVINELPQASIGLDETDLRCSPSKILFTNRSIGADTGYSVWYFEEGNEGIVTDSDTISWIFSAQDREANYVVRMTVRNACGTADATRNIKILPQSIKPFFSFPSGVFCPNSPIQFEDATVPAPTHWFWTFGGEGMSNIQNPQYAFSKPGTYEVTLEAGNQCATGSVTHLIEVQVPPKPEFTVASEMTCEGEEVVFANHTDTRYSVFSWDFGDGSPTDEQNYNPSHIFSSAGTYEVRLTIFDGSRECSSESMLPVRVNSVFQANFTTEVAEAACEPALVKFVNHTEGADTWHWEFTDGTTTRTSNVKEPLIPFTSGNYTIHLVASRDGACPAEASGTAYFDFGKCNVEIPEAFTPNGDLYGDRYTLFGEGIDRIIFLKIRNRWSEVVYEMEDVPPGSQAPGESWDGTRDGKPMPADMYVVEAKVRYRDQTDSDVIRANFYLVR